jgi:hypothetical protein
MLRVLSILKLHLQVLVVLIFFLVMIIVLVRLINSLLVVFTLEALIVFERVCIGFWLVVL